MIRIYSIKQALSLRGTIPELAVIRSIQFQGDGYFPIDHGYIVVLESGDALTQIEEIGTDELFDDGVPVFEYVEAFVDGNQVTYEIVVQLDDSRTIAVIADQFRLDPDFKTALQNLSAPPQPLPQLERKSS
jgi:hypothetical protein